MKKNNLEKKSNPNFDLSLANAEAEQLTKYNYEPSKSVYLAFGELYSMLINDEISIKKGETIRKLLTTAARQLRKTRKK